jgi:mRNA degradation ribonuclease J1/J2
MDTSVAPNYKIKKRVEKPFSTQKGRVISVIYEDEMVNIVEMIELAKKYDRPVSFISKRIYEYVKFLMDAEKIEK